MDSINSPSHYSVYPIEPIQITRHLGFCLGNAVKYVLRAPFKGGVEDCLKAKKYLEWELEAPQFPAALSAFARAKAGELAGWLENTPGDALWSDIAFSQARFLRVLALYACNSSYVHFFYGAKKLIGKMAECCHDLRRILALRDTTGQIYEGMSGLPEKEDVEDD